MLSSYFELTPSLSQLFSHDLFGIYRMNSHNYGPTYEEDEHTHTYRFNVAGYSKEQIIVKIHTDNTVSVVASSQEEKRTPTNQSNNESGTNVYKTKRSFNYRFTLPRDSDKNSLEGNVSNGELTLTLKKVFQPNDTERVLNLQ